MPNPPGSTADSRPAVCTACGCLCDDVRLVPADGRIREAVNVCAIGARWFQVESAAAQGASPVYRVEGAEVDYGEAVRRSAELLRTARAPVVFGLTQTTMETVRIAVELADRVGAAIDPGSSGRSSAALRAFQQRGKATATLGEVKNRADVILFWGADPAATHPRHAERYSIDSVGRFRPRGRDDRTILVVGGAPNQTSERADQFVQITDNQELASLWVMRSILSGITLDPDRVQAATGLSLETWAQLVDQLKEAEYGAIFSESTFGRSLRASAAVEALTEFVRELNRFTRCVALPLGSPGNSTGAESVLSWQTGFPREVDLGSGVPRSIPNVASAEARLTRREADLALIIADAVPPEFSQAAVQHLRDIPRIVIAPATVHYDFEPTVRFTPGHPFLYSRGTLMRCDGVPLPLRAPIPSAGPSDEDCLRAIRARLDEFDRSS